MDFEHCAIEEQRNMFHMLNSSRKFVDKTWHWNQKNSFYFIFLFAGKNAKKCFPVGFLPPIVFLNCIAATTHHGKHRWKDGSIPLQKQDKTLCSCQSVPYFQQSVFHVLPRLRTVTTTTYLVSGNLTQWLGCFKNGWVTGWGATLVSFYFGKTGGYWLWSCNGRGWTFFNFEK